MSTQSATAGVDEGRRGRRVVSCCRGIGLGSGALVALAPKCPACAWGYLSLLGLGAGAAEWLVAARPWAIATCVGCVAGGAGVLVVRLARRRRAALAAGTPVR